MRISGGSRLGHCPLGTNRRTDEARRTGARRGADAVVRRGGGRGAAASRRPGRALTCCRPAALNRAGVQLCVRLAARSGLKRTERRQGTTRRSVQPVSRALKLPRTRPSKAQLGLRQLLISPINFFLLFFLQNE